MSSAKQEETPRHKPTIGERLAEVNVIRPGMSTEEILEVGKRAEAVLDEERATSQQAMEEAEQAAAMAEAPEPKENGSEQSPMMRIADLLPSDPEERKRILSDPQVSATIASAKALAMEIREKDGLLTGVGDKLKGTRLGKFLSTMVFSAALLAATPKDAQAGWFGNVVASATEAIKGGVGGGVIGSGGVVGREVGGVIERKTKEVMNSTGITYESRRFQSQLQAVVSNYLSIFRQMERDYDAGIQNAKAAGGPVESIERQKLNDITRAAQRGMDEVKRLLDMADRDGISPDGSNKALLGEFRETVAKYDRELADSDRVVNQRYESGESRESKQFNINLKTMLRDASENLNVQERQFDQQLRNMKISKAGKEQISQMENSRWSNLMNTSSQLIANIQRFMDQMDVQNGLKPSKENGEALSELQERQARYDAELRKIDETLGNGPASAKQTPVQNAGERQEKREEPSDAFNWGPGYRW